MTNIVELYKSDLSHVCGGNDCMEYQNLNNALPINGICQSAGIPYKYFKITLRSSSIAEVTCQGKVVASTLCGGGSASCRLGEMIQVICKAGGTSPDGCHMVVEHI